MTVLFHSDLDAVEEWAPELQSLMPGLDIVTIDGVSDPASIDIALIWKQPPGMERMRNLKAILSLGAGIDQLDLAKLPRGVPIARLIDPTLTQTMVDYCLLAVMRHHRDFHLYEANSRRHAWSYERPRLAEKRSVGILGLGELGGTVALTLAGHGFRVFGWARSAKKIAGITCCMGSDGLAQVLENAEILVNLLPLTRQTEGILSRKLFEGLPRGACLVNVGRGRHLVEADLLEALDHGRIEAATLDVFVEEPLPQAHPFWDNPRILITPHVASTGGPATAAPQIVENIRRALADEGLLNAVHPKNGY